jgi:DNA-binding NarL/FixJ family response regulator
MLPQAAGNDREGTGARLGAASAAAQRSGRIAERTRQRHAAVHRLLAGGNSARAIAAELGLARNTVVVQPREWPAEPS